ncbi:MAG: hypothetical protein U5K69_29665 [Balneolaceae bacterium]|nr:hypothetical protein [Balneolaceae bacterium]
MPYVEQWYRRSGYEINHLDGDQISDFEGCGDAIWHTGRKLLWGGYSSRSSRKAYEIISSFRPAGNHPGTGR